MRRQFRRITPLVMFVALAVMPAVEAQTSDALEEKLRDAEVRELVDRDGESALEAYREIAGDESAPAALRARAYFRLAGVEQRRGNLQLAVEALEEIVGLVPETDLHRRQAERMLERLRRGDEGGAAFDWHEVLTSNPDIRSTLLELTTQLASPDRSVSRTAHRTLRAYGTLALPVLRGALRTATGPFRVALAQAAAEAGDWNFLGEFASDDVAFREFAEQLVAHSPAERDRLNGFLERFDPDPPVPPARLALLWLIAGNLENLASRLDQLEEAHHKQGALNRVVRIALGRLLGNPRAVEETARYLGETDRSQPVITEALVAHAGAALHGELLRKLARRDPEAVLLPLLHRGDLGVLAGLVAEMGEAPSAPLLKRLRDGILARDWSQGSVPGNFVTGAEVLSAVMVKRLEIEPDRTDPEALAYLVEAARRDDTSVPLLQTALAALWEVGTPNPRGRNSYQPSDPPPGDRLRSFWRESAETVTTRWRVHLCYLMLPDLLWMPELIPTVTSWLADPEFLSGSASVDLESHGGILRLLTSIGTQRLSTGRRPSTEERDVFERSQRAILEGLHRDFTAAETELIREAGLVDTSPAIRRVRLLDVRLRTSLRNDRAVARRHGYSRGLSGAIREEDWIPAIRQLLEREPSSVTLVAALLSDGLIDSLVSDPGKVEIAVLLVAHQVGRGGGQNARRSTLFEEAGWWKQEHDTIWRERLRVFDENADERVHRQQVASFLRGAIEDGTLPPVVRAYAFRAIPLATFETLTELLEREPDQVAQALSRDPGSWPGIDVPPWPTSPRGRISYPGWFFHLPVDKRLPALRALAGTGDARLLQLAVLLGTLGSELGPGADLAESERLDWLGRLVEKSEDHPRLLQPRELLTLTRRDDTARSIVKRALPLMSSRDNNNNLVGKMWLLDLADKPDQVTWRRERLVLAEQWQERARAETTEKEK